MGATALALTVSGCAGGPSGDTSSTPAASGEAGIHTTDALGHTVSVDHEPTAAMGFYSTDVDILATLGFGLNSAEPLRNGYTKYPSFFPEKELSGVTKLFVNFPEFDYETIATAKPDLILNSFGSYKDADTKLTQIAPTYSYDSSNGKTWLENFEKTAKDLGRQKQLDAWMQRYTAAGTQTKEAITKAGHDGFTVIPLDYRDDQFQIGCHNGVECGAFKNAGLTVPDISKPREVELSVENLDKLKDVDAVWVATDGGGHDANFDAMMDAVKDNPTWASLPFVKNNRIYTYDTEMSYGSPSGAMAFAELLQRDLTS